MPMAARQRAALNIQSRAPKRDFIILRALRLPYGQFTRSASTVPEIITGPRGCSTGKFKSGGHGAEVERSDRSSVYHLHGKQLLRNSSCLLTQSDLNEIQQVAELAT